MFNLIILIQRCLIVKENSFMDYFQFKPEIKEN